MKYYLAEACQNTFILFDCLDQSMVNEEFLIEAHQCLIEEGRDDALILVDGKVEENALTARMLVLGADGSLGEFCGNGSRACAAYLFAQYPHFESFFLVSKWGKHPLFKHADGIYSIKLPPARFDLNEKFISNAPDVHPFCYVEMIEPHLIIQEEMSDEKLFSLGSMLNQRKDLFPLGINVNAWHVLKEDLLCVKTYERGVQRLTRSCGTGSMSCAAFYKKFGNVCIATSGGTLEIVLHQDVIVLSGPACFSDACKEKKEKSD